MHRMISLRGYKYTRRVIGRRSITPMRGKKRRLTKTRCCHKVEKNEVSVHQQASSCHDETRKTESQDEHCEYSEWEGGENSPPKRKWKDTEKHSQTLQGGDCEHSAEPLHPGTVCTMRGLSEESNASAQTDAETEIETEELSF
jgi:hypothetical protein